MILELKFQILYLPQTTDVIYIGEIKVTIVSGLIIGLIQIFFMKFPTYLKIDSLYQLWVEENIIYFYSSGKLVFQYARWDEITRRIFEAAACNCCVLTNKLPPHTMIETLFVHNVSIIYYEGPFSLLKQLIRLKLKPNLAKQIANNGRNLVLKNHTQLKRAETLIDIVNDMLIKKR